MRTLMITAATAVALALAAAPAPAATQFSWSSPVQLSAAGQHAWTPEVAYSPNGSAVIAWGRYDGAQYVAQAVIRNANGSLGVVQTIATPSAQVLGGPKVGIDAQGNALLAWSRWDGNDFRVQARTLSAAGALGLTQTLSTAGQDASGPRLAVNRNGDGVVTWTRYTGDHYRVEGRTMSTTGALGGLEVVSDDLVPHADDMDTRDADVGIDGVGNATFVWQRYDLGLDVIITRTLAADGTFGAAQSLSYEGGSASPQVAVNEPGDVAFAWTRWDGTYDRIQGRVDLASAPLSGVKYLSASGQSAANAQVAIDGVGNTMFAWERWDGFDWRVQSVRMPAGGIPAAVETHSAAGESASDPRLAIETGGTAALTWQRWDGAFHRVQVRRLPASGIAGTVYSRSAAGAEASAPAIDVQTGGKVLLAWERFDVNVRIEYSAGSPTVSPLEAETAPVADPATGLSPVTLSPADR
jgi:hypothetical protein